MTIMGKILVIIILVLAVVGCIFIAIYSATAINWKATVEDYKKELATSESNNRTLQEAYHKLQSERNGWQNRIKELEKQNKDIKDKRDDEVKEEQKKAEDQKKQAEASQAVADAATEEAKRLRKEVEMHTKSVEDRDKTITKLNKELGRVLGRAVEAENQKEILVVRTKSLVEQIQTLSQKLARAESPTSGNGRATRDPNAKNPPAVFVKGVVTKVLKDRGLVEVSIGSDDGVNEGNTLEVYRLKPKPEYLGTIKILEAFEHKAVGRIIRTAGVRRSPIVKNDEVASKILAR
jgi:chromosome segregation ATPase